MFQALLAVTASGSDAYDIQTMTLPGVREMTVDAYRCPTAQLPSDFGGMRMMRSAFVGIAGSASLIPGYTDPTLYSGTAGSNCAGGINGTVSGAGMLFPIGQVRVRQISDGTSKTMLASECGALVRVAGSLVDLRTAVGFHLGYRTPSPVSPPPSLSGDIRTWNMTTVRYRINQVTFTGYDCANGGLCSGCQTHNNQPLRSSHRQGVNAVMADGSVRFLTDETDPVVLGSLCNRFDGQDVALP